MRLVIQLFAGLRERAGCAEVVLDDLPEAMDLGALKRELELRLPELGSLEHVAGVVGTDYAQDSRVLVEGDPVAFLPPVSGGAPTDDERLAAGVFELTADPIDPEACRRRVEHDSCGAVLIFCGNARDTNRGQAVVCLDYEAFAQMAGPEMERIFVRCNQEHGDAAGTDASRALRMLCVHRTGAVGVGEPSVVIAVASPHRDAAYLASRFLIDELKLSLPVWKKEVYADGHHWIGDRS